MTLGIVYHMPFWRAGDGTLHEVEGSFARYVDSLAPYFDEISLCVPVYATAQPAGTRLRAANVTVAPLPARAASTRSKVVVSMASSRAFY